MFTCPKCKNEWAFFTLNCVCGEQVLFIPPEIKEDSFLIYDLEGIEAVKRLISDHSALKNKQSETRTSRQPIAEEMEKSTKETELQDAKKIAKTSARIRVLKIISAIAIFSLLSLVSLYLITPFVVVKVEDGLRCDIDYSYWGISEYFNFWFRLGKYVISILFFVALFIVYLIVRQKDEEENPRSASAWWKTGAVLGAIGGRTALSGAVKGAAVGYAGFFIYGIIGIVFFFVLLMIAIENLGQTFQKGVCDGSTSGFYYRESVVNLPSNDREKRVFNCNALAKHVVSNSQDRFDKPNNIYIKSLIVEVTYEFQPLKYTECEGVAKLSNGSDERLFFGGEQSNNFFKLKYQTGDY